MIKGMVVTGVQATIVKNGKVMAATETQMNMYTLHVHVGH